MFRKAFLALGFFVAGVFVSEITNSFDRQLEANKATLKEAQNREQANRLFDGMVQDAQRSNSLLCGGIFIKLIFPPKDSDRAPMVVLEDPPGTKAEERDYGERESPDNILVLGNKPVSGLQILNSPSLKVQNQPTIQGYGCPLNPK